MTEQQSPRGLGAAARITALAASVMDLHVRMALQEVDRNTTRTGKVDPKLLQRAQKKHGVQ